MKTQLNRFAGRRAFRLGVPITATMLFLAPLTASFGQPIITEQPQSCTNGLGTTAAFSVTATGTEPLAYQWQKWNASFASFPNVLGANNASLVFVSVRNNDDGDFRVVVTNSSGAATSAVVHLYVLPNIVTQPTNFPVVSVGATVTTRVSALGSPPLAYQWRCFDVPLAGRTNNVLTLTNVPLSASGDYTVLIRNPAGAITSSVARLTVLAIPQIAPSANFQSAAVLVGAPASFEVTTYGIEPFAYQWRLDGQELPGQTDRRLTLSAARPEDEGDYSVVVTNLYGTATSDPARLWVVPPVSQFFRGDFYWGSQRLPYFYFLPTNYVSTRSYPLYFFFHGAADNESVFLSPNNPAATNLASKFVTASYRRQATDPTIVVWPAHRYVSDDWTTEYLQLSSHLLDALIAQYSIDTNRIYTGGWSLGVHAGWDMLGMRPGLFAGALLLAGRQGASPSASLKDVPVWAFCAADDDPGLLGSTRDLVSSLRRAGGNCLYTEYSSGKHIGGILAGVFTPAAVDWLFAQRRGVTPTDEPLLSITSPTQGAIYTTGATNFALAGSARALGQPVTRVVWTNLANRATGDASGTNAWTVTGIPLLANKTNVLLVTATTTSWVPAFGGNTTFNDTLSVIQSPLWAALTLQGTNAVLTWTGGGPPCRVQRATDLTAGDWTDFLPDATPPVLLPLPLAGEATFYRIVGQ